MDKKTFNCRVNPATWTRERDGKEFDAFLFSGGHIIMSEEDTDDGTVEVELDAQFTLRIDRDAQDEIMEEILESFGSSPEEVEHLGRSVVAAGLAHEFPIEIDWATVTLGKKLVSEYSNAESGLIQRVRLSKSGLRQALTGFLTEVDTLVKAGEITV